MMQAKIFLISALAITLFSNCDKYDDKHTPDYGDGGITLNKTGFEDREDESPYTQDSWHSDGFDAPWVEGFGQGRAYIDHDESIKGQSSLRITYPANTYSPKDNGAQVALKFAPRDEVWVSYWLKFSNNFDWGGEHEGGKLPGLATGGLCSGGSTCNGTNGFSARLMWHAGGKAVLYLYHMDKPGTYGEVTQLVVNDADVRFLPGHWYQVTERVKINTGNNKNGEVQLWINGKEALKRTGIRFVNNGDLVDTFFFSTFHGGGDDSWAPTRDCYIWYDDVRIFY